MPRPFGQHFLRHEPAYAALYANVWTYSDWAGLKGLDKRDTGIDLVAAQIRLAMEEPPATGMARSRTDATSSRTPQ